MKGIIALLLACSFVLAENSRVVSVWDRDRNLEFIQFNSAPDSNKNVIVLHGMGGMASNFQYLLSDFKLKNLANWWLVSLRNHGNSFDDEVMTVKAMAEDIVRLIYKHNIKNISLIGYSIGGRVAMHIAANYGHLIDSLAIIDFMPFAYPKSTLQSQYALLNTLQKLNISNMTFDQIKAMVSTVLPPSDAATFLGLIEGTGTNYRFACNLSNIANAVSTIVEDNLQGSAFKKPVKFIFAKKSAYFLQSRVTDLSNYYPNLNFEKDITYLENSEHLFPFTQPEFVFAFVSNFLGGN
jgi:pimeloyl-ACP methyl ester carboxylesterase